VKEAVRRAAARVDILEVRGAEARRRRDAVAVEEPLEIRVCPADGPWVAAAVTMRTPGADFELAAGFLFTEGVLDHPAQVQAITYCTDPGVEQRYNIVNVHLRPGAAWDPGRLQRNFYVASSCGVCGKASIDAVTARGVRVAPDPRLRRGRRRVAVAGPGPAGVPAGVRTHRRPPRCGAVRRRGAPAAAAGGRGAPQRRG